MTDSERSFGVAALAVFLVVWGAGLYMSLHVSILAQFVWLALAALALIPSLILIRIVRERRSATSSPARLQLDPNVERNVLAVFSVLVLAFVFDWAQGIFSIFWITGIGFFVFLLLQVRYGNRNGNDDPTT